MSVGASPVSGFSLSSVTLPIVWGDTGRRLITAGVIDETKLLALYSDRGGLPDEIAALLSADAGQTKEIIMTPDNAGAILNLLWAFGLANQNPVLGPEPAKPKG